jgi:hypothetical protein
MYVAYKSIDSELGVMYTASRQSSQGRQQVYRASQVDETINDTNTYCDISKTTRKVKIQVKREESYLLDSSFEVISDITDENLENDIFKDYVINDNIETTPYSTPSMLQTMTAVSTPYTFITSDTSTFEKDE